MPSFLRQVRALVAKQQQLRRVNIARTLGEIGVPLVAALLLLAIAAMVGATQGDYGVADRAAVPDLAEPGGSRNSDTPRLLVILPPATSPSAQFARAFVEGAVARAPFPIDTAETSTAEIAADCGDASSASSSCWLGVQIHLSDPDRGLWNYTVLAPADALPYDMSGTPNSVMGTPEGIKDNVYIESGVFQLIRYLDSQALAMSTMDNDHIGEQVNNESNNDNIIKDIQPFTSQSRAAVSEDNKRRFAGSVGTYVTAAFMTIALLPMVYTLTTDIVVEKQARLRETMMIMGLRPSAYSLSWILSTLIVFLPTVLVVTRVLMVGALDKAAWTILILVMLVYGMSLMSLAFVFMTFTRSPRLAGPIVAFATAAVAGAGVALTIINYKTEVPVGLQRLSGLASPMAFAWIIDIINRRRTTGLKSYTLADSDEHVAMDIGECTLAMLADSVLYWVIAWYLGHVFPGEHGVAKSWLFPFMPSFWCPSSASNESGDGLALPPPRSTYGTMDSAVDESDEDSSSDEDASGRGARQLADEDNDGLLAAESSSGSEAIGVEVRGLTKVFPDGKVAVDDLSFRARENCATALLGHNGAGKSTLISVLTGLIPPTHGDAVINGYSLRSSLPAVRSSLGVCPQGDVLWDQLTVRQTLQLYVGIKGTGNQALSEDAAVEQVIEEVGLDAKADTPAGSLSGGQKRRLGVAIAFLGGSKIVILDEMSSGVDPFSRRALWDLVDRNREGRTIIFTTHFLDEADLLGDRIAIMSRGRMRAVGSSMFLKRHFGVGYTLTCVMDHLLDQTAGEDRAGAIDQLVRKHVKRASIVSHAEGEVVFRLPLKASPKFAGLFRDLKTMPGLQTYGLSSTSLDEVFLRISGYDHLDRSEQDEPDRELGLSLEERREIWRKRRPGSKGGDDDDAGTSFSADGGKSSSLLGTSLVRKRPVPSFGTQLYAHLIKRAWMTRGDMSNAVVFVVLLGLAVVAGIVGRKMDPQTCGGGPEIQDKLVMSNNVNLFGGLTTVAVAPHVPAIFDTNQDGWTVIEAEGGLKKYLKDDDLREPTAFAFGECCGNETTLAYNSQYTHALPVAQNMLDSSMMHAATGGSIDLAVQAFPNTSPLNEATTSNMTYLLIFVWLAMLPFSFAPAYLTMNVVGERQVRSKELQLISGASPYIYWIAQWMCDIVWMAIFVVAAMGIFGAFGSLSTLFWGDGVAMLIMMLLFCAAILPWSYILSFRYERPAMSLGSVFGILSGMTVFFTIVIINILVQFALGNVPRVALTITGTVFSAITPLNALVYGWLLAGNTVNLRCKGKSDEMMSAFDFDVMGLPALVLIAQAIVCFVAVLIIEQRKSFMRSPTPSRDMLEADEEGDDGTERDALVDAEAEAVRSGARDGCSLVISGVQKVYESSSTNSGRVKRAVRGVSVSVAQGTCFGLLGPNGAGKSSLLKVLTGEEDATEGDVFVAGMSVSNDINAVRRCVGYCPQFDALLPKLTVRQQIEFFARLRGVADVAGEAGRLIRRMDLGQYEHKPCGLLSGGNKRKVSMAIACCGEPDCLLLDEPSTGMDSMAKRFMWDVIASLKKERAVVLTTHSMEEADAVCNRIGIMVDGRMRCLGTSQQLKTNYGHGYRLAVRTPAGRTGPVIQFVRELYGETANVDEERKGFVAFDVGKLPDGLGSAIVPTGADGARPDLSGMFEAVQAQKKRLRLRDFAISQTTLEQIFLIFGRQQLAVQGLDDYEDDGNRSPFEMPERARRSKAIHTSNLVFATVGLGLPMAAIYLFALVLYSLGIVLFFPQMKMALRMIRVTLSPYGRPLDARRPDLPPMSTRWVVLANILWFPAGLFSAGFHILIGTLLCMTVVLFPLGRAHWSLVGVTLAPFGRRVRPARNGCCCGLPSDEAASSPSQLAYSQMF